MSIKLGGVYIFLAYIGLYGTLFRRNKEAAFSNFRLWESAGFVIAYAYSTTLCARMKLYVLFGNLTIGVICYIIVEIRHRRKVSVGKALLKCTMLTRIHQQERRLKKQEAREEAARQAEAAKHQIEETDDERDDLEEDIEITHF